MAQELPVLEFLISLELTCGLTIEIRTPESPLKGNYRTNITHDTQFNGVDYKMKM